jgi:uncharacterized OsmC-like protein
MSIPGFDRDKLELFAAKAAETPENLVLDLEAKTIWEGHGVENLGKIGPWKMGGQSIEKSSRDFSIQFGAWKEVEEAIGIPGAHDRIEPMEAALAAIASCVSTAITINSAREGLEFEGLEVTAHATVDPRVLLGMVPADEAESCLKSVDVAIKIDGNLNDDQRSQILQMAHRSPVHAMVSGGNRINTTVT